MVYEIRKTDGTLFASVDDGTIEDSAASITFVGKRYPEYGLILNQNDLRQLENFASPVPPVNPIIGQFWYDTTPSLESIKVYAGGTIGWRSLGFSNNLSESEINEDLLFLGDVEFFGQVTANNFVEFKQTTSFSGPVQFIGNSTISGDVTSNANIIFAGDQTFTGSTAFSGNLTFGGDTTYDGNVEFNGDVLFNTATSFFDSNFTLLDNADPTKSLQFSISNLLGARTITVPDGNGELLLSNSFSEITNKSISDSTFNYKLKTLTNVNGTSDGNQLISVSTTSSPVTVTLSSLDVASGRQIIILDVGGNAGVNNITVDTEGSELINGASTATLSVDGGQLIIVSDGVNWFSSSDSIPGLSTANENEVFAADGLGGGQWRLLTPGNVVLVQSLSDLPTPVGATITLANNTIYKISGNVNIGANNLLMGASTGLTGESPFVDIITSTSASPLINATNRNFTLTNVGFSNSSGPWLSITGSGVETFVATKCINFACTTIGTITSMLTTILDTCQVSAASAGGLDIAGANNGSFKITDGKYVTTIGPIFDFGTSVSTRIFFNNVVMENAAGQTALAFAANSANLASGGLAYIVDNYIDEPATASSGYAIGDIGFIVRGNPGMRDNVDHAQGYIENSALNTSFLGIGSGNEEKVNFGAAFTAGIEAGMSIDTSGRFTFDNLVPSIFMVSANLFATIVGGAARDYSLFIAKNGTIIPSSVVTVRLDGTNPDTFNVSSIVQLSQGEYVEVYARAVTATTDLNVITASITVNQLSV